MEFKIKVHGSQPKRKGSQSHVLGKTNDGGRAVLPRGEKAKMGSLSGKYRKLSEGKRGP